MLSSSDAGSARAAAGARRGAAGRGVLGFGVLPRRWVRLDAARRFAACGTLRFVDRFTLRLADPFALRLAERCAVFPVAPFLLDVLRDLAAVFAVFRRFLAMRAPFS
jgi:hypothetical protein